MGKYKYLENWNKFNEELSPSKVYTTSQLLKDKEHHRRSISMMNTFISEHLKKSFINNGSRISENSYLGNVITYIKNDNKQMQKPILYIIPIIFTENSTNYDINVPFYFIIEDGINIQRNYRRGDVKFETLIDIIRQNIIDDFYESEIDVLLDNSEVDIDDMKSMDEFNMKLHQIIGEFSLTHIKQDHIKIEKLNRNQTIKVLNALKGGCVIVDRMYNQVKKFINHYKLDISFGEIENYIKTLKVNDAYRD